MEIKEIYFKPSKRKCSISDFKCFDILDQNKENIGMIDCDVIDLDFHNVDWAIVSMDIVDGMIHLWSHNKNVRFQPLINTFRIILEGKAR